MNETLEESLNRIMLDSTWHKDHEQIMQATRDFHEEYKGIIQSAGFTNHSIVAFVQKKRYRSPLPIFYHGFPVEIDVIGKVTPATDDESH